MNDFENLTAVFEGCIYINPKDRLLISDNLLIYYKNDIDEISYHFSEDGQLINIEVFAL